jgi:hypothetical protein
MKIAQCVIFTRKLILLNDLKQQIMITNEYKSTKKVESHIVCIINLSSFEDTIRDKRINHVIEATGSYPQSEGM